MDKVKETLKSQNKEYKIANPSRFVERILVEAEYIKETHATLRQTAEKFGNSKSTVHLDVSHRLALIDRNLYKEIREILDVNFAEKYIRGGEATKKRFAERTI